MPSWNRSTRVPRANSDKFVILTVAAAVLVAVMALSTAVGSVAFSPAEIVQAVVGGLRGQLADQIVLNVRVPRVLTGMLVGMNLAVAGTLLQGVLRNPMASPNIIGVNAGAGLAAVVVMTVAPWWIAAIPVAAFGGALAATVLIYGLSRTTGHNGTVHIVLAGIAVSSLLSAITSGLMMLNSDVLDITYSWLLGSLSGRGWSAVGTIWPYSVCALGVAVFIGPKLNLFALGDEVAGAVGLAIGRYRAVVLITAATLAGSAVAVAGTIGFVGLIAPHMARILIGNDHRYLVPLAAIAGAILLVLSDTVARTVFQPVELSVGIITSVLGAPFFLYLLLRRSRTTVYT